MALSWSEVTAGALGLVADELCHGGRGVGVDVGWLVGWVVEGGKASSIAVIVVKLVLVAVVELIIRAGLTEVVVVEVVVSWPDLFP